MDMFYRLPYVLLCVFAWSQPSRACDAMYICEVPDKSKKAVFMVVADEIIAGQISTEKATKPVLYYQEHIKHHPQGQAVIQRNGLRLTIAKGFSHLDLQQGKQSFRLACHEDPNHRE